MTPGNPYLKFASQAVAKPYFVFALMLLPDCCWANDFEIRAKAAFTNLNG